MATTINPRKRVDDVVRKSRAVKLAREDKRQAHETALEAQRQGNLADRQKTRQNFLSGQATQTRANTLADNSLRRKQSLADQALARKNKLTDDKTARVQGLRDKLFDSFGANRMSDKDILKANVRIDKGFQDFSIDNPREGEEGHVARDQYAQKFHPSDYSAINQSGAIGQPTELQSGLRERIAQLGGGGLGAVAQGEAPRGRGVAGLDAQGKIFMTDDPTRINDAELARQNDPTNEFIPTRAASGGGGEQAINWVDPSQYAQGQSALPTLQPGAGGRKRELTVAQHQADIAMKKRGKESKYKKRNTLSIPQAAVRAYDYLFKSYNR